MELYRTRAITAIMQKLDLAPNRFSESLPKSLPTVRSLVALLHENNQFLGEPPDLASLQNLRHFARAQLLLRPSRRMGFTNDEVGIAGAAIQSLGRSSSRAARENYACKLFRKQLLRRCSQELRSTEVPEVLQLYRLQFDLPATLFSSVISASRHTAKATEGTNVNEE
ncbi:putative receptor protein kinase [Trypanosoma cruzi]|nr:putative receptor protein kinase [Trypanosoma cruzi]